MMIRQETRKITDALKLVLDFVIVGRTITYCGVVNSLEVYCKDYDHAQSMPDILVDDGINFYKGIQNSAGCYMTYLRRLEA